MTGLLDTPEPDLDAEEVTQTATYDQWRDRLARANDPAFYPVAFQDHILGTAQAQFWANDTAAIITWIREYPGGARGAEIYAAAGDLEALLAEFKPALEAWASQQGCTHALITAGREGWRRLCPDYRHFQTILYKELQ